jgi:hypothetical protein
MSHHRPGRSRLARRLGIHGLRRLHLCLQAVGIVQHGVVEEQRRIEKTKVPVNHSPAVSAVLLLGLMSAPAVALRTTLILAMPKAIHTRKHATRERPGSSLARRRSGFRGRPSGRRTARGELAQHDHRSRAGRSSRWAGAPATCPEQLTSSRWDGAQATEAEAASNPETGTCSTTARASTSTSGSPPSPPLTAAGDETDPPKPQCETPASTPTTAGGPDACSPATRTGSSTAP